MNNLRASSAAHRDLRLAPEASRVGCPAVQALFSDSKLGGEAAPSVMIPRMTEAMAESEHPNCQGDHANAAVCWSWTMKKDRACPCGLCSRTTSSVYTAEDGATALELVQKQKIDVAILDIRMPGMSGVEVLERIKYIDPTIEVIMLTAFETTDTIRQALKLRACDYLEQAVRLGDVARGGWRAMQRRTFDTEILNNNEKLQQLVEELQNQKVEGQMAQTRGDIYASIIHDINGPLTVISGFLQLINQRIGPTETLDAEGMTFLKDRLRTMTRQVTNCIEISRRYLSFLRKQPGENARVGVNQLLADLSHLIRVHPSLQNNQFDVQPLGTQDVAAQMNGTDLIQMLLNLTVNAFQAAAQSSYGGHCRREPDREPLDLTQFKDAPGERLLNVENFHNVAPLVRLTVSDNGPGIPPEVLPKIFQPYFTTKDARQGTGLGLNIVQRLVKEGRGALHIKTEVGAGTAFTIYLPAAPAHPDNPQVKLDMKKILLVDDDALVLELYRKKLARGGFEVRTAADGLEAIKALGSFRPDLVVLDLLMPKMSGTDVLKFIRTKPALAKLPVVAFTNAFMSEQARLVNSLGVARAVVKGDFTPNQMLALAAELLQRRPPAVERRQKGRAPSLSPEEIRFGVTGGGAGKISGARAGRFHGSAGSLARICPRPGRRGTFRHIAGVLPADASTRRRGRAGPLPVRGAHERRAGSDAV
jgi:two-component system, sensor histidine kinase and response regulator